MVVNIANRLPRDRFRSHVCTTRAVGPLAPALSDDVKLTSLGRTSRVDISAARRLVDYVRDHNVQLVHVHGTSLFLVALASLMGPFPRIIWHDHFGRYAVEARPAALYATAVQRAGGVISVNAQLADWAKTSLHVPAHRVWYLPNFVLEPDGTDAAVDLPGRPGLRIVCVANFRVQKDHGTLLRAMRRVLRRVPEAHLILLGYVDNVDYHAEIQREMTSGMLANHVTWLGSRNDVPAILHGCDVGVLSSASEGLPLALLEYGMAGLATVTTDAGQCPEVVENGRVALMVPRGDADKLGDALLLVLESPSRRAQLGTAFRQRVLDAYSIEAVRARLLKIYDTVLSLGPSASAGD